MLSLRARLSAAWRGDGGGREVALVAYPLILGHLSFTLQTFVNRLFLTWYSAEAVAGAVTGLFAVWSLVALFTGTGEFLTTFVAQYFGAGRPERIGPAVWQGDLLLARRRRCSSRSSRPLAGPAFDLARHAPALRRYEVDYARTLMLGSFPVILMATLSTFFAGRGETQVILDVNVLATLVNVVLDYLLIFGRGGFPELGVTGAALAHDPVAGRGRRSSTWRSSCGAPHREAYGPARGWRLEPSLVAPARALRDADGPAVLARGVGLRGLHGRSSAASGRLELAASGIAFNLNMIVFMPMVGLAIGVSSLVGRYLGA